MLMAALIGRLLDVKGTFLLGKLGKREKIHMKVPEGFTKYYPPNTLLLLMDTLYELKQTTMAFMTVLLTVIRAFGFERSGADPCLYLKWN